MIGRSGILVVALLAWACEPASRAEMGRVRYEEYCSSCHPIAQSARSGTSEALGPDLTRLRERFDWPLPREKLAAFIDGRTEIEAHGPREMPVWGARLYEDYPQTPGTEAARGGTVAIILDYLETIQVE